MIRQRNEMSWPAIGEMLVATSVTEIADTAGMAHLFHNKIGLNLPTVAEASASVFPALMTMGAAYLLINNLIRPRHNYSTRNLLINAATFISAGLVGSQALPGWEGALAGLAAAAPMANATYQMSRAKFRR